MIVRATGNRGYNLPDSSKDPRRGYLDETEFSLTLGKAYVVYALSIFLGHPWYCVCDDDQLRYPNFQPGPLFDVINGHLSRHWEYGYFPIEGQQEAYAIFAFEEWARDPYYYDRLTDLEAGAVATFERYKSLIDRELLS